MTLIVALPAQDGVVFASDTQLTTGTLRSTGTKIYKLNDHALWGGSGEMALVQRVQEKIAAFPRKDQPLIAIRDELCVLVKDSVVALLNLDFRTGFFNQRPDDLLGLHQGDFLFVERRQGNTAILHVLSHGTPEWITNGCAATGSGTLFAHTLLAKYAPLIPLSRDHAKLLAYKVIEEAIQVGAYGLGAPIDILEVTDGGVNRATSQEVEAIQDAAEILRQAEKDLLVSGGGQRAGAGDGQVASPQLTGPTETEAPQPKSSADAAAMSNPQQ